MKYDAVAFLESLFRPTAPTAKDDAVPEADEVLRGVGGSRFFRRLFRF